MSLIGIDVGSSSVKVAVYTEEGEQIAVASHDLTPIRPAPGVWETDPEDVWQATSKGMRDVGAQAALRRDPPKAIAFSASGRENFPADVDGNPLGNGIMGADTRGAEFEIAPPGAPVPEEWCQACGHLRERMDPVFRLAWWNKVHPEVMEKAGYFFGWIDFLAFRMTGRDVMDQSTVSRYMVYDLKSMDWSQKRLAEYQVRRELLPEVLPWGSVIGDLKPGLAAEWNLPTGVKVAQGCHDLNCAAYGAGVYQMGTVCLVSGSYENILIPTDRPPTPTMLLKGLSVMPQPCQAGLSIIAVHPTGNAVLNWARDLTDTSIETAEQALQQRDGHPSPVLAVPYLSGSMTYWKNGRKARGGLLGLSLATSKTDVVQAFMESIAYDTVNTLSLMRAEGIPVERIRITGGGARSPWWTQLKADMTNMPIEVVAHPEPGTLGAALLAGLAVGVYDDMEGISRKYSGTQTVYHPHLERAALHQERFELYRKLMALLLEHIHVILRGKGKTDMKLGTATSVLYLYSLRDAIPLIAETGFDGVDIWGGRPHVYRQDFSRAELNELCQIIDRYGLSVSSFMPAFYRYPHSLSSPNPKVRQDSIEYMRVCIDNAAVLGARVVLVVPDLTLVGQARCDSRQRLSESIDVCARYSAQYDLKLGIEVLHFDETDLVNTADDAIGIIHELGHANLGVVLDTGTLNLSKEDPEEVVSKLGHLLLQVHVNDNHGGHKQQNLIPGEGTYDFKKLIGVLKEKNYQGFLSAELSKEYSEDPAPALRTTVERLRAWGVN